jgi:hypothetical protein
MAWACLGLDSGRHSPMIRYLVGTRTRTVRVYPLVDGRTVTLSPPPVHTKLSFSTSRMATQRDVEFNQMFLNACVLLDVP